MTRSILIVKPEHLDEMRVLACDYDVRAELVIPPNTRVSNAPLPDTLAHELVDALVIRSVILMQPADDVPFALPPVGPNRKQRRAASSKRTGAPSKTSKEIARQVRRK